VKKLSIVIMIALVVALAVPAMAATTNNLKANGHFEIENDKVKDGNSATTGEFDLFLNAKPADNVNFYSELDYTYDFANGAGAGNPENLDVYEMWVNIDNAFGPVSLKAGRMYETAPDGILYEFDSDDFARLAYANGGVSAKFGHNLDTDNQGKVVFAQGSVKDLGLADEVTVNYVDDNDANYDGYTVKATKHHNFGTGTILFGDANDAQLIDLGFSTKQLLPGATASLEYANVEEGFARATAQDSVLTDTALTTTAGAGDVTMIKPGVNFNITNKLNAYASYAMYSSDNAGDHDYLDTGVVYSMANNTSLEVELEDNSYDNAADSTTITTTLGVDF